MRRSLTVLVALLMMFAISVEMASAAGGTKPTQFKTGSVDCTLSYYDMTEWMTAKRPVMQTAGSYFNGYFQAFSVLQFSTDRGATWQTWAGTKRSHGKTRVRGSGTSAFHGVTWGTWSIPAQADLYAMRVKTTFRWLNPAGSLVAKRTRIADWYRTTTYWPGGGTLGQVTYSRSGCVLLF